MATEILKIDASWAEEFTKTSEQILMTPTVKAQYLIHGILKINNAMERKYPPEK